MTAHLTLPYQWTNCSDHQTCPEHIHLEDTAENLNNYPIEWVEQLLGNCSINIEENMVAILGVQTIEFYDINSELHSDNTPASIQYYPNTPDYSKTVWFRHGKLHRENGPASEKINGETSWYLNGERHREGGPAYLHPSGETWWCLNGRYHREDGPAYVHPSGETWWYLNGERHRENGPAVEHSDGTQEWWVKGIQQPKPQTTTSNVKDE
jgi:hypothetical protein